MFNPTKKSDIELLESTKSSLARTHAMVFSELRSGTIWFSRIRHWKIEEKSQTKSWCTRSLAARYILTKPITLMTLWGIRMGKLKPPVSVAWTTARANFLTYKTFNDFICYLLLIKQRQGYLCGPAWALSPLELYGKVPVNLCWNNRSSGMSW